jgi:hypothetical protein
MLDENEFLSPHGIRSVSRFHRDHRVELSLDGTTYSLSYAPAESVTQTFGGNSNWRGPVWFPTLSPHRPLQKYHHYFGSDFKVECPTGSGNLMTLWRFQELNRLVALFTRRWMERVPLWWHPGFKIPTGRLHPILEYFHGDNGASGASRRLAGLVHGKAHQQTTDIQTDRPSPSLVTLMTRLPLAQSRGCQRVQIPDFSSN